MYQIVFKMFSDTRWMVNPTVFYDIEEARKFIKQNPSGLLVEFTYIIYRESYTNYDAIRDLSIEQLAPFFYSITGDCTHCIVDEKVCNVGALSTNNCVDMTAEFLTRHSSSSTRYKIRYQDFNECKSIEEDFAFHEDADQYVRSFLTQCPDYSHICIVRYDTFRFYDHIQYMSLEKLTKYMVEHVACNLCPASHMCNQQDGNCEKIIKEYLNTPYSGHLIVKNKMP